MEGNNLDGCDNLKDRDNLEGGAHQGGSNNLDDKLSGDDRSEDHINHFESTVLLLTVFIVGLCTIIYELLIGSVSSYLLGDSVTQFSITIGLSMTAMGVGTLLSRYLEGHLIRWFVWIELVIGVLGGLSVPLLFAAYTYTSLYYPVMVLMLVSIGTLIGLEIPLLTRIMEGSYSLRSNISNVLSLDYFGALIATLLFPFILLPFLGIFKSAIVTGVMNLVVGVFNLWCFREKLGLRRFQSLRTLSVSTMAVLLALFFFSETLLHAWETSIYEDRVILSRQSSYQRIVLTKNKTDFRLYLDGNLQFSSIDEYRYHEALAHIPLSLTKHISSVLVLGGGDGLLTREILKHPGVKSVTIVDLDPEMTQMAKEQPLLLRLNEGSLHNPKVHIVHDDAFKHLENTPQYYDIILADLPDPKNSSLSRLYSREFFKLVKKRLSRQGVFVTQSTSPFFAKKAFWCIHESLKAAKFNVIHPYHAYVPSMGDWGFMMASHIPLDVEKLAVQVPTRFLHGDQVESLFYFSKDLRVASQDQQVSPSSLDAPHILQYYLEGWKHWN